MTGLQKRMCSPLWLHPQAPLHGVHERGWLVQGLDFSVPEMDELLASESRRFAPNSGNSYCHQLDNIIYT